MNLLTYRFPHHNYSQESHSESLLYDAFLLIISHPPTSHTLLSPTSPAEVSCCENENDGLLSVEREKKRYSSLNQYLQEPEV
jgi:hypothetical protein